MDPHQQPSSPFHTTANHPFISLSKKGPSLILLLSCCGGAGCDSRCVSGCGSGCVSGCVSGWESGWGHGRGVQRRNGMRNRCHATRDNIGRNVIEVTVRTKKNWELEAAGGRAHSSYCICYFREALAALGGPTWMAHRATRCGTLRYDTESTNQLAPTARHFPYLSFFLFVSNTLSLHTHAQVSFIMSPVPPSFVMLKEMSIFFILVTANMGMSVRSR